MKLQFETREAIYTAEIPAEIVAQLSKTCASSGTKGCTIEGAHLSLDHLIIGAAQVAGTVESRLTSAGRLAL